MAWEESEVVIRRATEADAGALGVVGPAAYAETYAYLWDDPLAYLRQLTTFSTSAFAELIARENAHVWVAAIRGEIVGFLSMNLDTADPVTGAGHGAEIARIYILRQARRLRLGHRLLEAAIEESLAEGTAYVWLHVMASADWARRAYAQWGFSELGGTAFAGGVAEGLADMVVMARPISRASSPPLDAR